MQAGKSRFSLSATTPADGASERSDASDSLNDIIQRGAIRVAVPQDFAPFGSPDESMRLRGLDIDIATLIARELNVKATLVPVTSAQRITYLQTHAVDLVISTLGKDAHRESLIDFSQAYAPFNNSVFGPTSFRINGPKDLAGLTIGVTRGAIEDLLLTKTVPASTHIRRFNNNNALINAYRADEISLIGTGDIVALKISSQLPPGAINMPVFQYLIRPSACFVGMNKDRPTLLARVNTILTAAKRDGSLNAIVEKWLNMPLPPSMANSAD